MIMGLAEQVGIARNEVFRDRVQMALVLTAQQIAKEPSHDAVADNLHAPYWGHRHSVVTAVLNDSAANVEKFAWAVAPLVPADCSDDDLLAAVALVWDEVSGAAIQLQPGDAVSPGAGGSFTPQ
jgi:hypothetical protein